MHLLIVCIITVFNGLPSLVCVYRVIQEESALLWEMVV
jgi:hypothetical protein